MNKEIWLCHWMFPLMFLSSFNKAKESIKDKEALNTKLIDIDEKYMDIAIDYPKTKPANDKKARDFLKKVSGWMNEGNK
jgi:hypothetical protein